VRTYNRGRCDRRRIIVGARIASTVHITEKTTHRKASLIIGPPFPLGS
jgi:hypothetical protein